MDISIISSKGQVTIPKEVRDEMGLKRGDILTFQKRVHKEVKISKREAVGFYEKAKLTEKGQVTIPKGIRDDLQLKKGDEIVFSWVNFSIFFRKKGDMIPCPVCEAIGIFGKSSLPCFVCDQSGDIEEHEQGLLYTLLFENKLRKYGVSLTIIQQELGDNKIFQYTQFPKLELRSEEYPKELLYQVRDKLQMLLVEERLPKKNGDYKVKLTPSDKQLNEIRNLFVTDEAKREIKERFGVLR